jgi:predicted Zn-dependent peptidase
LPEGVELTVLPSGIRVVTEAMPGVRSVAVGFWLNCGSRDEVDRAVGSSHFLEHLLFKGTNRRSAADIAEAMDSVGGELNAFTGKEYTCFFGRCLDDHLPLAIDVLGDMVTSSILAPEDMEAEREVVLSEIRAHLESPDDLVQSLFAEAVFGEHPLGREILGDQEQITGITRDDVAGYYAQRYGPEGLVVAAAGNLDHDAVVTSIEQAVAGFDQAGGQPVARGAPDVGDARLVTRDRPTEQTHLVLGGRGLARGDERRYAASVLDECYGGGMSSRLFQKIREQRGLAYTVFSHQSRHADAGTFGVYVGTAPQHAAESLEIVRRELSELAASGPGDDELARGKGHLAGQLVLSQEDTGSRMTRLGSGLTAGVPVPSLDEALARVEAVSRDDVREVAAELASSPLALGAVGPVDEGVRAELAEALEPLG